MNNPSTGIRRFFHDHPLATMFIITALTILIGTVFYHLVEGLRWIDALYFSMMTITTVGYGDISPQTDIGKLFTVGYIIIGMTIILGFINTLYANRVEKYRGTKKNDSEE